MATTPVARPAWPAKKPYSSTTVTVPLGDSVTLKQPTFRMGLTDASTKISQMVEDARLALSKVLTINPVALAYKDDLIKPVEALFNPERNPYFNRSEAWEVIKRKLTEIYRGLKAAHSIKVGTLDTGGVGCVKFYTDDTEGDIHLAKHLFENVGLKGNATLTYLHEASHKYAKTFDHAYWKRTTGVWRPNKDAIQFHYEPTITNAKTLNNADSFAFMLYYLKPQPWRH